VDSFTKKNPDCYPQLSKAILDVAPSDRDGYLDDLGLLSGKVRELELLHGRLNENPTAPLPLNEIVSRVLTLLQQRPTLTMTDQQKTALIAVYFLITKYWGTDSYPKDSTSPDKFPELALSSGGPLTPDIWLTEFILAHPDEPEAVYERYKHRRSYRKHIDSMFHHLGDQGQFYSLPEQFCDYPEDMIRELRAISTVDIEDYNALRDLAIEGISAIQMKEALHFPGESRSFVDSPYSDNVKMGATLRKYEAFQQYPDLTLRGTPQHEQCVAILKVALECAGYASEFLSPENTIADARLVNLLLSHPEQADDLVVTIRERRSADFDLITGVNSNVLGEGLL
jgi:hypothetical protein